jgi:hypothetical protein
MDLLKSSTQPLWQKPSVFIAMINNFKVGGAPQPIYIDSK